MSGQMVLRCTKTGRLFFSTAEATEHAEAFGKEYANFDEVGLDHKVWVAAETGRVCYTEADLQKMKVRDPDSKTWEEKTVAYLMEMQKKKDVAIARKEKFFSSVDQRKLELMISAKSLGKTRSAKALHFTREKGTIEAAEAWLEENQSLPDLDKLTDAFVEEALASLGDVEMPDAHADVDMTPIDDRKIGDPNPPEIKEKINQDLLKQVMEMGFSEVRAEKALYKTDNASLEYAVNWLAEHAEDADIDLPLLKPPPPAPVKPKMSKEEAEAKALELQKRLREKRAAEEKEKEKEKEAQRKESTKLMAEAQERAKEEDRRRAIEQQMREKEEHDRHRAELKERLRQDYIDRFGCEPPEEKEEECVKEKTSKEQLAFHLNKLKKTYKDSNAEGLKTCLNTLKIYIKNLHENPLEVKFKKLKLDNKAFQSRIVPYDGALDVLDVLGFEKKEDCLEQRKSTPDGFLCGQAIKFIDLMLGQI
ncbi:unnamed protein product [Durusdinium trenchii]|uniref:UBA domain-containing protein n=1 Tax=Durusdinium trenchii TaxID=1381693 RepID=A0ABP0LCZ7_9DINO